MGGLRFVGTHAMCVPPYRLLADFKLDHGQEAEPDEHPVKNELVYLSAVE